MSLTLRPFELEDEEAAISAWRAFQQTSHGFLTLYEEGMPWPEYLAMLADHREGRNLPEGFTKYAMYAAVVEGEFVGRASVRFELNEKQAYQNGNVGYGVVEAHRRRGYATEILRQSLIILAKAGISPAMVTCWDHNIGSAQVIENTGGRLESMVPDEDGVLLRRYWVAIQDPMPLGRRQ